MIVDGECCSERLGMGKVGVRGLGIRHMSEKEWEWKEWRRWLTEDATKDGNAKQILGSTSETGSSQQLTTTSLWLLRFNPQSWMMSESDHYDGDVGLSSNPLKGNVTASGKGGFANRRFQTR